MALAVAPAHSSRRARIAAASELQQVSRLKYVLFIILAIFIQLNWGLFGVCSRYLQTRSAALMPSMQLMVMEQAVALAGLIAFVVLPSLARAAIRKARGGLRGKAPAPPAGGSCDARVVAAADDGQQQQHQLGAQKGADERRVARLAKIKACGAAASIGLVVAMQALTLVWASRLIYAFLVQLVMLLTPLVTAVANRLLLRKPTPRGLWPALVVALGGSGLVIAGNYMSEGARIGGGGAVGTDAKSMVAGLALAVTSMLLLSSYLVALQVTQHVTTGRHVMFGNILMGLVVMTPLAFAVEGVDWSWVHRITMFDWGVLAFAGFFIDALNTLWTQKASRVLGAAIMSLFICMRLVSSVAGSAVLLGEAPTSPLVWAGMGVCVAAMTAFLGLQVWDKKRAERAAAAAEGAAGGEGDVEEGGGRAKAGSAAGAGGTTRCAEQDGARLAAAAAAAARIPV